MADRSIRYLLGEVKVVLVKVDKYVYSCDFVVLEMGGGANDIPFIFGRPFFVHPQCNPEF